MPCVHRTKIFLTRNVIDRQTHNKHNNIAKFIHKYGQNKRKMRNHDSKVKFSNVVKVLGDTNLETMKDLTTNSYCLRA